jgi:nitrite reductase/ring-hydroxylating ferredoxin subunit
MKNRQSYIGRRHFLGGVLGGGAAALGATAVGPLVAYVGNARSEPLPEFLVLAPAEYELEPGQAKIVGFGPLPVLLIRTPEPDSSLKVFLAECTHFDCVVGYQPDEGCILCACHEGRFDLDGNVISGPPPKPLTSFYHAYHEDRLVIALEKENLDKAREDPC